MEFVYEIFEESYFVFSITLRSWCYWRLRPLSLFTKLSITRRSQEQSRKQE